MVSHNIVFLRGGLVIVAEGSDQEAAILNERFPHAGRVSAHVCERLEVLDHLANSCCACGRHLYYTISYYNDYTILYDVIL